MDLLKEKVIFLTGGSKGIGLECAKRYVEEGAFVVIASDDRSSNDAAIEIIGDDHVGIVCDVSKSADVEEAIQETFKRFGRIDVIHNNAGTAKPAKALHLTEESEWDHVINVNLKSVFLTTRYGLPFLKQSKGSILSTSSLVGEIGQDNHAAYSATKGGLNALTKSMALDYAPFKIRVNAVAPAAVWTPMLREWSSELGNPADFEQYLDEMHPLGYCPDGDVVADACVFLVSDNARFITGCILPVSGGAELGYRNNYLPFESKHCRK